MRKMQRTDRDAERDGGSMVNDVIGRGQADVGAFLSSLGREVQTAGSWICLC